MTEMAGKAMGATAKVSEAKRERKPLHGTSEKGMTTGTNLKDSKGRQKKPYNRHSLKSGALEIGVIFLDTSLCHLNPGDRASNRQDCDQLDTGRKTCFILDEPWARLTHIRD